DGAFAAVNVGNGSNKAKNSPFFNDYGFVKVLSVKGKELVPLTEAKTGHWCRVSPGARTTERFWFSAWSRKRSWCSTSTARSSSRPDRSSSVPARPASGRRSRSSVVVHKPRRFSLPVVRAKAGTHNHGRIDGSVIMGFGCPLRSGRDDSKILR